VLALIHYGLLTTNIASTFYGFLGTKFCGRIIKRFCEFFHIRIFFHEIPFF